MNYLDYSFFGLLKINDKMTDIERIKNITMRDISVEIILALK